MCLTLIFATSNLLFIYFIFVFLRFFFSFSYSTFLSFCPPPPIVFSLSLSSNGALSVSLFLLTSPDSIAVNISYTLVLNWTSNLSLPQVHRIARIQKSGKKNVGKDVEEATNSLRYMNGDLCWQQMRSSRVNTTQRWRWRLKSDKETGNSHKVVIQCKRQIHHLLIRIFTRTSISSEIHICCFCVWRPLLECFHISVDFLCIFLGACRDHFYVTLCLKLDVYQFNNILFLNICKRMWG